MTNMSVLLSNAPVMKDKCHISAAKSSINSDAHFSIRATRTSIKRKYTKNVAR